MPARVLMQDFTGVPAVVDLAAMRDAMKTLGGDPEKINPLQPAELVIDHSVQVDEFGTANSYDLNAALEFTRNRERYAFLKWGQTAFRNFSAVPPGMGICHQVNLEYLARVVFTAPQPDGSTLAYPDTLVGTDSHTTMVNGLGVLGWGVGGIEAEAAMLGQPVSMLVPQVVGFRLTGKLREGATATDLVLTVTEALRKHGVVGKFVEFFGPGIAELPLADRATIANMAPEYGATCGIFPVDNETLKYLRLTGRTEEHIALVEAYFREQGLFHTANAPEAEYSSTLSLDLATVEPSVAGPRRPQDRVLLSQAAASFEKQLPSLLGPNGNQEAARQMVRWEAEGGHPSGNGNVTSSKGAPNGQDSHAAAPTSVKARFGIDPDPYLGARLHRHRRHHLLHQHLQPLRHGRRRPARQESRREGPADAAVGQDLARTRLPRRHRLLQQVRPHPIPRRPPLPDRRLRLHHLHRQLRPAAHRRQQSHRRPLPRRRLGPLRQPQLRGPHLPRSPRKLSDVPPLVVAYALAGHIGHNFATDPLGKDKSGQPVFLKDIWPSQKEVADTVASCVDSSMFRKQYATVTDGDANWQHLKFPSGNTYGWEPDSTYIRKAPYFDGMTATPAARAGHPRRPCSRRPRRLRHHRPHLPRRLHQEERPRRQVPHRPRRRPSRLQQLRLPPRQPRSHGARHLRQRPPAQQARPRHRRRSHPPAPRGHRNCPSTTPRSSTPSAASPSASSPARSTAQARPATGPPKARKLLGIRFVIAESYERIHRSNLVGMGILPLEYLPGQSTASLGLTGEEIFTVGDHPGLLRKMLDSKLADGRIIPILAENNHGKTIEFSATIRIDTPQEILYYQHGGILPYVLRQLAAKS